MELELGEVKILGEKRLAPCHFRRLIVPKQLALIGQFPAYRRRLCRSDQLVDQRASRLVREAWT